MVDTLACFSVLLYNTKDLYTPGLVGLDIYCRLINSRFLESLAVLSSSYGLCLVTFERYIGIVHPLHYPRVMSAKKTAYQIFLAWIISFLISCPNLFVQQANTRKDALSACHIILELSLLEDLSTLIMFPFSYIIPIVFMSWAYYKIQATLKKSARQLQQQNVQGAALELLQARQNVISMLRIVMGALLVLWTPLIIWLSLCLFHQNYDLCQSKSGEYILFLLIFLYDMNSVINPIIYVFKYKKFRKGLQEMFYSRCARPNLIGVQIAVNEENA